LAELQKDKITRGDFIGFGVLGGIMGAALVIPSTLFVVGPVIDAARGQSDVADVWRELMAVSEIPAGAPTSVEVDFPITQSYGSEEAQEESGNESYDPTVTNLVWLSWHSPSGYARDSERPGFLDQKSEGFTEQERQTIQENLNILSNSCAHLGCPVRWLEIEGVGEFLCPCHGGIYDLNGEYIAGPPPRGMYSYPVAEVRDNGMVYIKHEFDGGAPFGDPHVI
jgi:Rieske Fe-S protein